MFASVCVIYEMLKFSWYFWIGEMIPSCFGELVRAPVCAWPCVHVCCLRCTRMCLALFAVYHDSVSKSKCVRMRTYRGSCVWLSLAGRCCMHHVWLWWTVWDKIGAVYTRAHTSDNLATHSMRYVSAAQWKHMCTKLYVCGVTMCSYCIHNENGALYLFFFWRFV